MPQSPSTPPDLARAYQLLKTAERGEAARVLKVYLKKNPRDATGWWLMAHAVTKPENVRTCLERVLAINPEHARARDKLAALVPAAIDEEPDDSFFGVSSTAPDDAASAKAPADDPPGAAPSARPFTPTPLSTPTRSEVPVPPAAPAFAPQAPFTAQPSASPFTADPDAVDQPAFLDAGGSGDPFAAAPASAGDTPADQPSRWAFDFGDDMPTALSPVPAEPDKLLPNTENPFLGGAAENGWGFESDGNEAEKPFTGPVVPAFTAPEPDGDLSTPDWLAQLDATDIRDPFAPALPGHAATGSAPGTAFDWTAEPGPSAEPAAPALTSDASPFAPPRTSGGPAAQAQPDWTAVEVGGVPEAPPANPFAAQPPATDPFAARAPGHQAAGDDDPFAGVSGADDPFADVPVAPDFSFAENVGPLKPKTPPGPVPAAAPEETQKRVRRVLGITLLAVVLVAIIGGLLYVAQQQGVFDPPPPDMTTLDAASFTVAYPKGWDAECKTEALGYPVCGIANHEFYNQVDLYLGTDVDFAEMFSQISSGLLFGGNDLPETQVSIVIMDVPRSSPAYDGSSWAKTKYEWYQAGIERGDDIEVQYDQREITIDGRTAYTYHYDARDPASERSGFYGRDASYDVYIEHDGLVLWMTVSSQAPLDDGIPDDVIEAVIESIRIK